MRFLIAALFISLTFPVLAQDTVDDDAVTLPVLIEKTANAKPLEDLADSLGNDNEIRLDALREAAISYGARGGLAKRTADIRDTINTKSSSMDQIYDFRRLLIPAPSGLLIEPPIISEGVDAALIESGGQTAAVADRIYNINRNARIVSTPRNWRAYLERDWGKVELPPQVLFPQTAEEKKIWIENLTKGWDEGTKQANEIFQADLDKLVADYSGMIRYRKLLAQGIVSAPFALQVDRGVTGGGDEMRVGDRAVQITGPSQLMTEAFEWQPVSR